MKGVVHEPYSILCAAPLTLNSVPLICNTYMRLNWDFFIRIFDDKAKSKELLIIHPGTNRLLPSAIVCAAFASLFLSEVDIIEYYRQFIPGELVIRGRERYRFYGVDGNTCILKSDDKITVKNSITKIPLARGLNIRPYKGASLRTGTQGSGHSLENASSYLQCLVGDTYRNQAVVQPLCTLIVCTKEKAQYIVEEMAFEDDKEKFRFADVFPTAWARSIDDFEYYFGEIGKSNPTVLFTNRISLAREILYDDIDYKKRIFTVILDSIKSADSVSEINDIRELIGCRQYGRILIFQSNDKIQDTISDIISNNTQTVIWSPKVLLSTIDDLYHQPENPDDRAIMDAINRTIDNRIERNVVKSPNSFSEIKYCKTVLQKLLSLSKKTSILKEFMICAYGLINIFQQAAFTMDEYEHYIERNDVNARSPRKQINRLYELADLMSFEEYKEDAHLVTLALEDVYKSILHCNFKRDELIRCVQVARDEGKICGIVVPKRSFIDVTSEVCSRFSQIRTMIFSCFSCDVGVDCLIITATPNIKPNGLNPLAGGAALETIILEYDVETTKNNCYQRKIDQVSAAINRAAKRSAPKMFGEMVDMESFDMDDQVDESELDETAMLETELMNIETNMVIDRTLSALHSSSKTLRAIRFAQFDTGEWALFTQYYKAYVLNEREKRLFEKFPVDLHPSDILVFSASSGEITDFVDDILKRLITHGNNTLSEHYKRSKYWKMVLNEHMLVNKLTCQDISDTMKNLGHPRHAVTVGTWLREDSIIVGPRDEDAFIAIGLAADNNEIADHAKLYKESCDYIRRQRMKILNYVQTSIIQAATGNSGNDALSREETSYLGDVKKYARKLTIEHIVPYDHDVPNHLINRPIGGK